MDFEKAFQFLIDLKLNNYRQWFQENKPTYEVVKTDFEEFVNDLIAEIRKFDSSVIGADAKNSIFRIYRDARFSENKEPYKTHLGAFIAKDGRTSGNAGYYLHFEPDNSFFGGGIYAPDSSTLHKIRETIYQNPNKFRALTEEDAFKKYFPKLYGDTLKTAPKGFSKDFKDIDLLNYKHYAVSSPLKNEFWLSNGVLESLIERFAVQHDFISYLNATIK